MVERDDDTVHTAGTIGPHMLRGAAWMVAMRWCVRLIGLVSTVILARLLTPSDFGVIAMAMVFVVISTAMIRMASRMHVYNIVRRNTISAAWSILKMSL